METRTVKWFNSEKGFQLVQQKTVTMYSFISQLSKATDSKLLKKVKQ